MPICGRVSQLLSALSPRLGVYSCTGFREDGARVIRRLLVQSKFYFILVYENVKFGQNFHSEYAWHISKEFFSFFSFEILWTANNPKTVTIIVLPFSSVCLESKNYKSIYHFGFEPSAKSNRWTFGFWEL